MFPDLEIIFTFDSVIKNQNTMSKLITRKDLIQIGFESEDGSKFKYHVFGVQFTDSREHPIIWIDEILEGGNIAFPGAYTIKDLKDLMFFYYGENEYTERFGHLPINIVE